jgi:hypothetical protein
MLRIFDYGRAECSFKKVKQFLRKANQTALASG